MLGKTSYIAARKILTGSISYVNNLGDILDGMTPFSVDAMVRVMELLNDKSILTIDGLIDFGIHGEGLYVKIPGYSTIFSNDQVGTLRKDEWIHVAVTSDGNRVSLFIDGVLNCSTFCTSKRANKNASIIIGDGFTGDIRYVRIFDEFLDADAVKEIMHEPSIEQVPLAWFDFTQNPAKELISDSEITLVDVPLKSYTTALSLFANAYVEVPVDELVNVRPGYYDVQNYSVQMHFKFEPGDDGHEQRYVLLSDMGGYSLNGIKLWLEQMEDGYHLCFLHAFIDIEDNKVISTEPIQSGIWTNIAITFDVDTIAFYINGKLDIQKDGILPSVEYDEGRKFIIGANYEDALNDHVNFFAGYISQCDVWTKTLSEAEVHQYIDNAAEADTEELGFSLTVDQDGCFNGVTYNAVSLSNHAKVVEEISLAVSESRENAFGRHTLDEPLSQEELISVYDLCASKWMKHLCANGLDSSNEMPYMVKAINKNDMVYFVGCYKGRAYTVGFIEADLTTEEIRWWVELVLMIIGGICSAIFGLRLRTESRQMNKLINLFYSNAKLSSGLKALLHTDMSALAILQFCKLLYKENVLIDIIKLVIIQVSFWSIITICAKFVSWATGYGWAAAAAQLGTLVVEIGLHIASYPNEEKKKQPGSATLVEVVFADIMSSEKNHIENCRTRHRQCNQKSGVVSLTADSINVVNNGYNTSLSSWSYSSETPAVTAYPSSALDVRYANLSITVKATFILNHFSDTDQTVLIRAEGRNFYGNSNQILFNIPAGAGNLVSSNFVFKENKIGNVLQFIDESISWYIQWENSSEQLLYNIPVKVYTLLAYPTERWVNQPINYEVLQLLYNNLRRGYSRLNVSSLAKTVTEIANTQMKLAYTPASQFVTAEYGNTTFNLTRFVQSVLNVREGNFVFVNCSDCAALITTFCSMLGASLYCERMCNVTNYQSGFRLAPIISVGSSLYSGTVSNFLYHEVAMQHITNAYDTINTMHKVYDASLKVNLSNPPVNTNTNTGLPCGMSFSQYTEDQVSENRGNVDVVDDSYREHLCLYGPTGIGSCYYQKLPIGMSVPLFI